MNIINFIENCLNLAEQKKSKLESKQLNVEGMIGDKTRHFYNNNIEKLILPNNSQIWIKKL